MGLLEMSGTLVLPVTRQEAVVLTASLQLVFGLPGYTWNWKWHLLHPTCFLPERFWCSHNIRGTMVNEGFLELSPVL